HAVHPVSDGVSALHYARTELPDLILLDIVMPRIDGYKVCRFLKDTEETREIPVIFMTSLAETSDKVKGFRLGASDYITKPFQSEEVMARVETLLALRAVQNKLKTRNVELLRANDDLAQVNKALSREIAERTQAEAELKLYREQLEDLVRARTAELAEANRHLESEIAERRRAEEQVTASLREKEILLREIHHRVKNNLQIISALLHLQSDSVRDEESLSLFRVSQERIKAMALVHEKLYKSKDLASIDFGEYVENLTRHLALSYVEDPDRIVVKADAGSFSLDIEEAIPCGLIINELISNSLKHAFPDGRGGEVTVSCHADAEGMVTVEVRD
ncbi:response regulator, partial [bacterium]